MLKMAPAEARANAVRPGADGGIEHGVGAQREEQRQATQRGIEPHQLLVKEQQEDVEGVVLHALGSQTYAVRELDSQAETLDRHRGSLGCASWLRQHAAWQNRPD
jgi:hypothetical protein